MRALLLVCICVFLSVAGQLLLKLGASQRGELLAADVFQLSGWVRIFTHAPVLAGLTLWTLSTFVWLFVLAKEPLSYAYTLYGLTYVLTPLLAVVLFQEGMSPTRALGSFLVAAGVLVAVVGRLQELHAQ